MAKIERSSKPIIAIAVSVLPEPDAPITASVLRSAMEKFILLTSCSLPLLSLPEPAVLPVLPARALLFLQLRFCLPAQWVVRCRLMFKCLISRQVTYAFPISC